MHLAKTWYELILYSAGTSQRYSSKSSYIFFQITKYNIFMNTLLSSKKKDFKTSSNEYEVFVFKSLKL